ncbi:MAG TPA: hypothetical protein VEM36_08810 [Xanthobacteraceae bacterium]|nr:hypothetical protein [Xanthobacteraceae bacterium]
MKKLAIALAAAALLGVATPASAQGVYFGFDDGYRGWWGGPGYYHRWGPSYGYAWGPRYRYYRHHRYYRGWDEW